MDADPPAYGVNIAGRMTLQSAFGFIPNLVGAVSSSPVLIGSLVELFGKVHGGSFTEAQIQILLLTNAVANESEWAVAFHSALAVQHGIDSHDEQAIRSRNLPTEPTSAALSELARSLIEKRGKIEEFKAEAFLSAGFTPEHLLEVIAVIAASTITNYAANVAHPPLEDIFSAQAWHAA